jgi:hypothetical protein
MKKSTLCLLLAFVVAGSAHAQERRFYAAVGKNFDGSEYRGSAYIEKTADYTCHIVWRIQQATYEGFCMVYRGFMAVSFTSPDDDVGLVIYKINADGSMEGGWTYADTDGIGTERLTPITRDNKDDDEDKI